MATIKKISGLSASTTLTSDDYVLVEDATSGALNRTTISALGGAHTHSYAGSTSAGGSAKKADTVALTIGDTDASRFVIFQSSGNDTSTLTPCYSADFKYNPSTNKLNVGKMQLESKVTLQYNSTTESLNFVFA